MNKDLERLSGLILDAISDFRQDFDTFRDEMTAFRLDGTERLSRIELEISHIHRRLDRLEEDVADIRGYAKEIDDLRARLRTIEQHLGLEARAAA